MDGLSELSDSEWYEHWLDTPIMTPGARLEKKLGRPCTEQEAFVEPGCCVKSKENERGMPKWHGRLKEYSDEKCVVAAHGGATTNPRFVWEGTSVAYEHYWRCD